MKKIVCLGLNGRGGTLHYASNLTSEMANLIDTSLLLPSYSNTKIISKKVNLIRIKAPPNPLKTMLLTFNFFMHKKVIEAINLKKPDVINILDIHPWYVLYWPFLKAKKKIVTINDPELHSGEAGSIMTFLLKIITKFLLKNADEIIVLGKKQEKSVRKLGYKQKIIVSRIGHYAFFSKQKVKSFKKEQNTLLFFGRIREYKGLRYLMDALILLKNNGINFKLIVAGEGDISDCELQIKKLGKHVELHQEYVSDEKVSEYFQRASFVVMPYTDATQTGVIQVSYSYKTPVIASTVGSLPELVVNGETGLLVPPRNVNKLSVAIEKMLRDSNKTKEMGENAFKFMKKELDWKKIVKKLWKDINVK